MRGGEGGGLRPRIIITDEIRLNIVHHVLAHGMTGYNEASRTKSLQNCQVGNLSFLGTLF